MSWDSSTRRADLPRDWAAQRRRILRRDQHTCRIAGPKCIGTAGEVHHLGARTDHRDEQLVAACRPCHGQITQQQSTASRMARARRPVEPPPGLIIRA